MSSQIRGESHGEPPMMVAEPAAPTTTSLSSPESSALQTLAFGIIATFLATLALYLSYRQLQAMRRHRIPPSKCSGHEDDVSELPLRVSVPRPNSTNLERPLLTARVFTLQQYVAMYPSCYPPPTSESTFPSGRRTSAALSTVTDFDSHSITIDPWSLPTYDRRPTPWEVL